MYTKSRMIEVASDQRRDDKGREVYPESRKTRLSENGKTEYHQYILDDALIVAENSDLTSLESIKALDDACYNKYGKGLVKILNGQGLPLTATTFVQKRTRITDPALREKAEKLAAKTGLSFDEAMETLQNL